MFRTSLLLILPLVVSVFGQWNSPVEYYGTSNVRLQRPGFAEPLYRPRPIPLPPRPEPAGPVEPIATAAPTSVTSEVPFTEAAPAASAAPVYAPAPTYAPVPRPLIQPGYRPLLPPRPLRPVPTAAPQAPTAPATEAPQPLIVAASQPPVSDAIQRENELAGPAQPEPTSQPSSLNSTPVPEAAISTVQSEEATEPKLPVQLTSSSQPEQQKPIALQPEPISPQPEPIYKQPETVAPQPQAISPQPEPVAPQPQPISPQPEPVAPQPQPISPQPEPAAPQPQPIAPRPEPIAPQPQPIASQPEPVASQPQPIALKPEPIAPQPEQVAPQPQPIAPKPEPIAPQPEPVAPQPQPIPPKPEPIAPQPEPVARQPQPIARQPEPIVTQSMREVEILPSLSSSYLDRPMQRPEPSPIRPLSPSSNSVALLPLLPKPQSVREPAFGRPPQTKPALQTYYPTPAPTRAPPVIASTQSQPLVNQPTGTLKLDFQCKEGNGYYSVPNECDTYYECKQDKAKKYSCPDGLHFNPAAKPYEYPCAYPSEVKCTAGAAEQSPIPTNQCPNQYGFYAMKDGDCSKFMMCQEGLATIMDCPMGLAFNPQTSSCDWPANVPQCNPDVFKDFTCPDAPVDENGNISDIIYKYRYGQQCHLYIACQRGHPRLLSCDPGLAFDDASQSCIDEDYVTDCATPYSSS